MKKMIDLIEEKTRSAFARCGYEESYAKASLSNRPDRCEYQCNGAMAAAKAYKKKPIEIANEVVAAILEGQKETGELMFSEVQAAAPGFINLRIAPQYLSDYLNGMRSEEKSGLEEPGHGETIIVDYGGANVAKPLHVGHLRSAVIGEAVRRMGNFLGYRMIGDVHLGDWGLQMGLIIEELRDRRPELPYFDEAYTGEYPKEPPFTIGELEDIYPAASLKSKKDEAFRGRAQEATRLLQEGYAPFMAIWKHIMAISLEDLKRNYDSLDVHFDLWKGESDAQRYIPWLINDLEERGIAHESKGALVVDISQADDTKELPPCIIRKSDGAALYATSDLGTIIDREKTYSPMKYIYITDKRQELHFKQVFRVARKAGYVRPEVPMVHIGFGTMNGKDGKAFKTREGGVMRLEQLIADIGEAAYERLMQTRTSPDCGESEEKARETARLVGLAALKYGDLSNQAAKDYVFDIDRFTSFEGNTGPYILYTIVRIKSILAKYEKSERQSEDCAARPGLRRETDPVRSPEYGEKAGIRDIEGTGSRPGAQAAPQDSAKILPARSDAEKSLMLLLARYNEAMETSFEEVAPHKLCQYIFELSNAFNSFYHDKKILSEEDPEYRAGLISLISLVKAVLCACIEVLGFSSPDHM